MIKISIGIYLPTLDLIIWQLTIHYQMEAKIAIEQILLKGITEPVS